MPTLFERTLREAQEGSITARVQLRELLEMRYQDSLFVLAA